MKIFKPLWGALALAVAAAIAGCGTPTCDPAAAGSCGTGLRCNAATKVCEQDCGEGKGFNAATKICENLCTIPGAPVCEAPLACDPTTGTCRDVCAGVTCGAGQKCNPKTGSCVSGCDLAKCDDDTETCDAATGSCVARCEAPAAGAEFSAKPTGKDACAAGKGCNAKTGYCVPLCELKECPFAEWCELVDGKPTCKSGAPPAGRPGAACETSEQCAVDENDLDSRCFKNLYGYYEFPEGYCTRENCANTGCAQGATCVDGIICVDACTKDAECRANGSAASATEAEYVADTDGACAAGAATCGANEFCKNKAVLPWPAACTTDGTATCLPPAGEDADGDGISNLFEGAKKDADGNIVDAESSDTDKDGTPDYKDTDSDNDGTLDQDERGPNPTCDETKPRPDGKFQCACPAGYTFDGRMNSGTGGCSKGYDCLAKNPSPVYRCQPMQTISGGMPEDFGCWPALQCNQSDETTCSPVGGDCENDSFGGSNCVTGARCVPHAWNSGAETGFVNGYCVWDARSTDVCPANARAFVPAEYGANTDPMWAFCLKECDLASVNSCGYAEACFGLEEGADKGVCLPSDCRGDADCQEAACTKEDTSRCGSGQTCVVADGEVSGTCKLAPKCTSDSECPTVGTDVSADTCTADADCTAKNANYLGCNKEIGRCVVAIFAPCVDDGTGSKICTEQFCEPASGRCRYNCTAVDNSTVANHYANPDMTGCGATTGKCPAGKVCSEQFANSTECQPVCGAGTVCKKEGDAAAACVPDRDCEVTFCGDALSCNGSNGRCEQTCDAAVAGSCGASAVCQGGVCVTRCTEANEVKLCGGVDTCDTSTGLCRP